MAPLRRSVTVLGLLGTGMLASIGTLTDSGSTIILGLAVVAAAVYAGHRKPWVVAALLIAITALGGSDWTDHGFPIFLAIVLVSMAVLLPAAWPWGLFGKVVAVTAGAHLWMAAGIIELFWEAPRVEHGVVIAAAAGLFACLLQASHARSLPRDDVRPAAAALGLLLGFLPMFAYAAGFMLDVELSSIDPGLGDSVLLFGGILYSLALGVATAVVLAVVAPKPTTERAPATV